MIDAFIPYGAYWSTPFCRWQGAFSHLHALEFAAFQAKKELEVRNIDLAAFDSGVLGTTIPQHHAFYGLPWITGCSAPTAIAGPTINQACATSVRCLAAAAHDVVSGDTSCAFVVTADRTSNGPHVYYPAPSGAGGTGAAKTGYWTISRMIRLPNAE